MKDAFGPRPSWPASCRKPDVAVDQTPSIVSVEIQGQRYPIKSTLDPAYVRELAGYVDAKMAAAAEETRTADTLRLAVVAALNIADEFFRARGADPDAGILARRAADLEGLVDRALALAGGAAPSGGSAPGGGHAAGDSLASASDTGGAAPPRAALPAEG
jgi:cell division protein ZapA